MAATAAYIRIAPAGTNARAGDNKSFSNIGATSASFTLIDGRYYVGVKASTYGTVTLQILAPDDTTWLTAVTAFSADGFTVADLPAGTYRVALA